MQIKTQVFLHLASCKGSKTTAEIAEEIKLTKKQVIHALLRLEVQNFVIMKKEDDKKFHYTAKNAHLYQSKEKQLLDAIKRPRTIEELAEILDSHPDVIRGRLNRLRKLGYINQLKQNAHEDLYVVGTGRIVEAPIFTKILDELTLQPVTYPYLAKKIEESPSKVRDSLRTLVRRGKVVKIRKHTVTRYALAGF